MCTAISVTVGDNYFGRNLDYEHTFGEKIVITPRNYKFVFRNGKVCDDHYSIIGAALPFGGYPLYFDGTNEKGLSMAGLNFPGNAKYMEKKNGKENVASFEFVPYVLCSCETVAEAEKLITNINVTDEAFNENMSPTPLHWMIADKDESIVAEQTAAGMKIYKNPVGVLTNNPTFDNQIFNLTNYMSLSPEEPENRFSDKIDLSVYSRGMGGLGLPGDLSSMSRFVKTCFTKLNSVFGETEEENVAQFFHILYSVYQQKGCVKVGEGYEKTNYTSCCNTSKGIYYYTTYYGSRIYAVDMKKENLDGEKIITYDMVKTEKIPMQN